MADYPEHEKLKALGGGNQTIGDFIEWLGENGLMITRYHQHSLGCSGGDPRRMEVERGRVVPKALPSNVRARCGMTEEEIEPAYHKTESLIAQYFDIDPEELEKEKDKMLEEIRA